MQEKNPPVTLSRSESSAGSLWMKEYGDGLERSRGEKWAPSEAQKSDLREKTAAMLFTVEKTKQSYKLLQRCDENLFPCIHFEYSRN